MGFYNKDSGYSTGYDVGRADAFRAMSTVTPASYPPVESSEVTKRINTAFGKLFFLGVYFLGWAGYGFALAVFEIDMFWLIFAPFWPVILVGWILYEIFAEFGSESVDFIKESKDFVVALYYALIA
ncbi:hypothetical protein U0021_00220 [Moraxella canis]|uniref:Uncharacterized protein n=1 Tax=Moraxella canis TaxID=90239 RepID=A0ABZ0WXS5_9GAMM|nr:hypothetical protein [Moraxella canis]WQE04066.1 hypothetical protein U0021_00220 [Moraxella canis]